MSNPQKVLEPTLTEPWIGNSWSDIPEIPNLGVDTSRYAYVSQGLSRIVAPAEDLEHLGSDGFSFCSGLVMMDPHEGTTIMAHLEPHSETIVNQLLEQRTERMRLAALFYGSLSVRQIALEQLVTDNYFGPVQLAIAHIESGNSHWGMALNFSIKQVKTFARKPDQTITTFKLPSSI